MIMKYGDKPKRKMKKAARKMGKAARKGALASIVGSAAMKAKKKDAYDAPHEGLGWADLKNKKDNYSKKNGKKK